ncbi:FecCD family ABC transporter permease [Marinomonas algicola]|uniref:FecCD family ABC transporter permease n=1 Tax=Marinomonas algicola TaxID=2773454 RepID=UPI001EFF4819|nr:iron ABC transporter permease [Marinomonas algicola]
MIKVERRNRQRPSWLMVFFPNKVLSIWAMALLGLACVMFWSLSIGAYTLNWGNILRSGWNNRDALILLDIRLPRVLLSASVGAALAVSGAALQGLFRNPLADPGLIGISSGAVLSVALVIVVFPAWTAWSGLYGLSFAAFIGGALTCMLIFRIGRIKGANSVLQLILAGVAINALAGAAVGFLTYLSTDSQLRTLTFWTMGSFGGAMWPAVWLISGVTMACVGFLMHQAGHLNRLLLGEAEARFLGTDTKKLKRRIIFLTALAVGCAVAVSGIIGFVGLVVPHLIRLMWKADHRVLIPASALLGAGLMVLADTFARIVVTPAELPVGIVTSLLGGPFFLWLLFRPNQSMSS